MNITCNDLLQVQVNYKLTIIVNLPLWDYCPVFLCVLFIIFSFHDLEMNLQALFTSTFSIELTQLELMKGKQRNKMLRFSLKAYEIKQ